MLKQRNIILQFSLSIVDITHRKIQKQTTSEKLLTLILRSFLFCKTLSLLTFTFGKLLSIRNYFQLFLCTSSPAQKGNRKIRGIYQMKKIDFSILKETILPKT